MSTVNGYCDPKFEKVKTLLEDSIESDKELGASISLNIDGKTVIDIYGGYADFDKSKPWEKDTIVNIFSSTKTITALAVLMLRDRGLLDVDENVAKYWPEFAANGKENIKVRHFLSHTSGVSGWDDPLSLADLLDTPTATAKLAKQAPWWEPGIASGYHAITMGNLLGELVLRVSGKSLTQFVAEEIAGPLGADFQIGAKEDTWDRVAPLFMPPQPEFDMSQLPKDSLFVKTFSNPQMDVPKTASPEWKRAELGALNGHTTARAIGTILSAITLGGTVNGHELLSKKTIDRIFEQQSDGLDLVIGQPIRFGIGYAIAGGGSETSVPFAPKGKDRKVCFWGGWGGSWEIMDLDKRVTLTYVMNKMGEGVLGSAQTALYMNAVYELLDSA
ncbi:beta-lactamase [Tothia fuscella]|uniref:Beta-lactamase n=1 Tax=Tothia fuscella TaxID=1048955 RepID=A0A9P4TTM1_9PEZI|nr:beta-lactamase [Tothia fuscella]